MLLIVDEERGLVIAGIMGAEDAEVGEETEDALIEVANFDGRNILETSQRLGLRGRCLEPLRARPRPEHGGLRDGQGHAAVDTEPGGRAAPDTLSHYPEPVQPWRVTMRLERARLLLGMPLEPEETAARLESLELRSGA